MDVVVSHRDAHGIGGNRHALDHDMRVELQDVAVLAGTGLTFVRIAHQVFLARKLAWHETPLQAGRETSAAAPAQCRLLDSGHHLIGRQPFAAVLPQDLAQRLVTATRLVLRQLPIGTI